MSVGLSSLLAGEVGHHALAELANAVLFLGAEFVYALGKASEEDRTT